MFCPNCGSNLPDNSTFCGNCGAALKATQPRQTQQATAAPFVGTAPTTVKMGAAIMIAVLIIFSVLPIILWFCENVGLESGSFTETATWSELWPEDEDRVIVEVFRWTGIVFLAINAALGVMTLATGKYKTKRTRFIFARFASLINLLGYIVLYIAFLDDLSSLLEDYAIMTFSGIMFIISCVVLFVLPFFISYSTKVAKTPTAQPYQQF